MLRGGGAGTKPGAVNGTNGKRGFFKSLAGGGSKPKDKPQYDGDMKDGKACGQVSSCGISRVGAGKGGPQAGAVAKSCAGSVNTCSAAAAARPLRPARGLNVRVGLGL